MKTMKLGKTGIDISRIGLGTWSIGGGSYRKSTTLNTRHNSRSRMPSSA
ncbi:hypothetical protein [[Ruminococcus] torques]